MLLPYSQTDLNRQTLINAHRGTSFSPERRADTHLTDYLNYMKGINQKFEQWVTDENREAMEADLLRFKEGYLKRYEAWMYAKSRCISWMITGPSGFPTRRAEKANQSEHNRLKELIEWEEKVMKRLEAIYNPVAIAHAPISSDDPDAIEKLQKKATGLKANQERMKAANKIIRGRGHDKVGRLVDLGYTPDVAEGLIAADSMRNTGFPRWQLSNNLANIKRIEQRIADLEHKAQAAEAEDREVELANGDTVTITEDKDDNRIRLIFPGKPDANTRSTLKRNGFRWSPRNTAWQRQLNANGRYAVDIVIKSLS